LEPNGYDLVKFIVPEGDDERWLPTYGNGGYLYLMERLVPGFSREQEVSMEIYRRFEMEFSRVQVKSTTGQTFIVSTRARCPVCGTMNLDCAGDALLDTPSLEWMEYELGNF
jgi:hypothetical protein